MSTLASVKLTADATTYTWEERASSGEKGGHKGKQGHSAHDRLSYCPPTSHRGVSVSLAGYVDPACYLQISRAHKWAQAGVTQSIIGDL